MKSWSSSTLHFQIKSAVMLTLIFKIASSVPAISDGLAQNVGILLFLAINIRRADSILLY